MNKSLFSGHFLHERLPHLPEWDADPGPVYASLLPLWQKAQRLGSHWNEAQTEDEFVKPVLELLGWSYTVQAKSNRGGQVSRPDYALFLDAAAKETATPFQGQDDAFFGRVAVVGEVKSWGRALSQTGQSSRDVWKANRNPSHQMVGYLVGSRVEWGILTNGREWRLYSREVSSVASEFYSVDLVEIFGTGETGEMNLAPTPEQLDAFRRWWLFFRRDAFVADAQSQNFVERVHSGSASYARQISDKLKEIVFEEVMPAIAGGFVAYRHNEKGIPAESEADLRAIYAASLSLLYKLLFLLYGEARSLLPMENDGYRYESLSAMARRFADWRDSQRPISGATHATGEYDRLRALFHRVDRGDPSLAIPRYNGGLFDPHKADNAFLESHKLSDRAVAEAVDLLVRDRGEAVDYAFIDVRNLGAIYEGLLENRLRVIDAATGRVELVNDKGERKASGSYYTPDYIVKYIVEQTLQPILDERAAVFAGAMERVADVRRRLQSREGETANRLLQRERETWERAAQEAFLGITVCDPAMGSGHFLVNAVDYLTDGIIERMERWRDANPQTPQEWNPLYRLIGEVRRQIVEEMAAQAIPIDPARLDDTALLTRLVMKRCIYGVDLNLMAVELAKLSLWLHSFTVGAPLSFLDHHLRWGNSLIGADVKTVEAEIRRSGQGGQLGLFGGPFAGLLDLTEMMLRIAGRTDSTLADVRRSAAEFDDFESNLLPYKRVLDLWVSQYFGNRAALEFLTLYGGEVLPSLRDGRAVAPPYAGAIERAGALWQEKRFFHWDLEFPEVFVDLERRDWKENPGFDAVIGNPPYFSVDDNWGKDSDEASYLKATVSNVWMGKSDVYYYFFHKSVEIGRNEGTISLITSRYFLEARFAENLRLYLLESCAVLAIVDFGNFSVFDGIGIKAAISVLQKQGDTRSRNQNLVAAISFEPANNGIQSPEQFSASSRWHIRQESIGDESWNLASWRYADLIAQIDRNCQLLSDLCFSGEGMQTGLNGVFVVNQEVIDTYRIKGKFVRKLLKNQDIRPYELNFRELYLIYPEDVDDIEQEPELFRYLSLHKTALMNRAAYKRGNCEWYKLTWPLHKNRYQSPKLVVPFVAPENRFALDETGEFVGLTDTYAIFPTSTGEMDLKYILAVLNSTLINFRYRLIAKPKDYRYEYFEHNLNRIPIRRIDFTTPADERAQAVAAARSLYAAASPPGPLSADGEGESVDDLLAFVDEQLAPRNSQPAIRNSQPATRTDVVHDLLAFLAEQMIDANKAKQSEMAGFLAWLEREMGGAVNDLNGKTTIQNYLGDYQKGESPAALTDLLEVLRKNRRKLSADPSSRAFQEALAREYTASLDKLLPLKARLAHTDRLIDRIVYRLYGLTEEEIAIVKG